MKKSVRDDGMFDELPERVVIFGIRWKRRKGKPLQLVNTVCGFALLNILETQKEIAEQCKVPMSWVEYKTYGRGK